MTEPLRAISADDSALCLLKAVQLGHVEVALQLLQSGIQLSRRLEKEDLEADAPSEVESVWEFHRGAWRWRSTWKSSWRWSHSSRMTNSCPIGGTERQVWRTFVPRTESDSEDSFSDDPDEWTDPLENDWRCEGSDDGVCFFDWYYQGCRCQWAADWDRPITECQARVNTPTTKLLLEIAKGGQLFALAISEDGLARLLDAAILLGQVEAVAAVVARYPQTSRPLRFWAINDLVAYSTMGGRLALPDQVMAAVAAGANVSSIIHPLSRCSFLFQCAVEGGHAQIAEAMQKNGVSMLHSSSASAFMCYSEPMQQFQLRESSFVVAARAGAGLGHLRVRCLSRCTTTACTAQRECFDVSLLGFAILAGDSHHIGALMGQLRQCCSLAFRDKHGPSNPGEYKWQHICEMLSGHCHLCGSAAMCTAQRRCFASPDRCFASPDQRRHAAVAALHGTLIKSYQHAGTIYGPALLQWAMRLFPGHEVLLLVRHILTFACNKSKVVAELSDLTCRLESLLGT